MMKLNKKILLLSILILGFILRLYKVGKIPPSLYWDEAAMALDAKSVSLTGKDHHGNFWVQPIYPSWGDYKLPGYILSAVPVFKIIGDNPELAIRLPSVIAGTLTILIVYFLTQELLFKFSIGKFKNWKMGLIASFFLAISPWHLHFSRAAFEGNLALFFNFFALLLFLKSRRKKIWLSLVIIFSVFGIYTYYSARIVLPIILFLSFLFFWRKSFKNILIFVLSLGLILLAALPLRFSLLASRAEQFRLSTKNILTDSKIIEYSSKLMEQDGNNFIAKKIHHRFLYQIKVLASHYFDQLSFAFLLLSGDSNLRHSTRTTGVLLIVGFLGLVYGEYLLWLKNKNLFFFLNLCLFISFLPACIPYEVPHALRSLNAVVFLNIITGFGLVYLIKFLRSKDLSLILYSLFFILITQFVFYLHDYYVHYPGRSFLAWQGGYKEAVEVVNQEYEKTNSVIFTNAYARPYLYFLLYSDYPLEDFQKERQKLLINQSLSYQEIMKIDKIEFRGIDFEKDTKIEKVLLIGTPEEIPEGSVINNISTFVLWKNY